MYPDSIHGLGVALIGAALGYCLDETIVCRQALQGGQLHYIVALLGSGLASGIPDWNGVGHVSGQANMLLYVVPELLSIVQRGNGRKLLPDSGVQGHGLHLVASPNNGGWVADEEAVGGGQVHHYRLPIGLAAGVLSHGHGYAQVVGNGFQNFAHLLIRQLLAFEHGGSTRVRGVLR